MTDNRSLFVGHDGSALGARALEFAADLAEGLLAPVRVMRTWGSEPDPSVAELLLDDSRTREEIASVLMDDLIGDCADVEREHPQVAISYAVEAGPAAQVLCNAASAADARMLVIGSRGLGNLPGLLLGSVSNKCLHLSKRPVLVVPSVEAHPTSPVSPLTEIADIDEASTLPLIAPGTILVGDDGSGHAEAALLEALSLAEQLSAPVAVVRCWTFDTAPKGVIWHDGAVSSLADISSTIQHQLSERIRLSAGQHPTVTVACYAVLGRASEILVALSSSARMLVVGSRGRGGFGALVMGSVSLHCAHRSGGAVLVVPPRERAAHA